MKNATASFIVLTFLVLIDIFLTLGVRDRGLNVIERLGRIEQNQTEFLHAITPVRKP
jgi:hypothetical protein